MALHLTERRALLIAGDVTALAVAGLASLQLEPLVGAGVDVGGRGAKLIWLGVIAVAWLVTAAVNSCYDVRIAGRFQRVARMLVLTLLATSLVYTGLFFVFGRPIVAAPGPPFGVAHTPPPRVAAALFLATAAALVLSWRAVYARLAAGERLKRRLLVIGAGRGGAMLARELATVADVAVIGFIDDDPAKVGSEVEGLPVIATSRHLVEIARRERIDEAVLAVAGDVRESLAARLLDAYESGLTVRGLSEVFEDALGRVPVEYLGRTAFPSLFSSGGGLPNLQRAVKRAFDLLSGIAGLGILALLHPFIAAAIVLDSGRPVFYSQPRLGRGGRLFRILKYRSMITGAELEGEEVWAAPDDPRVTRVGRLLRLTRLDELPQFLNVVRGEMSVVGPRPERPQLVDRLASEIPLYRARLAVKPGLTGWAQINFGYANTIDEAARKLQYDLYYIKRNSLWLDVLVLLRTIRVVLSFNGT